MEQFSIYPMLLFIGALVLGVCVGMGVWFMWQRRRARLATLPYLELEPGGKRFYLTRPVQTLGRASDCHIKIRANLPNADTVSEYHARLLQRNGRWVVLDGTRNGTPSLNGITVNGKRTLANYLEDGDVLTCGALRFRFHLPTSSQGASQ